MNQELLWTKRNFHVGGNFQKYHFRIIEDASHALGAKYRAQAVGSCQYSDITVFSFHPVKIITTMEGGAALTNKSELARKIQLMRSHGVTAVQDEMTEVSHGPWYYQQVLLGFNYRMTDLQAALGLSQLNRLQEVGFRSLNHLWMRAGHRQPCATCVPQTMEIGYFAFMVGVG